VLSQLHPLLEQTLGMKFHALTTARQRHVQCLHQSGMQIHVHAHVFNQHPARALLLPGISHNVYAFVIYQQ
jgi:hypothetical protein